MDVLAAGPNPCGELEYRSRVTARGDYCVSRSAKSRHSGSSGSGSLCPANWIPQHRRGDREETSDELYIRLRIRGINSRTPGCAGIPRSSDAFLVAARKFPGTPFSSTVQLLETKMVFTAH